jgi:hypothetical protein
MELDETGKMPRGSRRSDVVLNLLTALLFLGMLCFAGLAGAIFIAPESIVNPFPPPTLPAMIVIPSSTSTPRKMPATWTATVTLTAEPSGTPIPEIATNTPEPLLPVKATGAVGTTSPNPVNTDFPFALRNGDPIAISSTVFHPESACNYEGIAGQVFDLQGAPVIGIYIEVSGSLGGQSIQLNSLTGTARQFGDAGYEIKLADKAIASNGSLWVRLYGQGDIVMSDKITFDTFNDCAKNLILINFKQVR